MTTALAIPPLRQSLVEVAACPHSYAFQVIEGNTMPSGLQSARGTEIHRVMAQYIKDCAAQRVSANWTLFDALAIGAGDEAAEILNGLRDSYEVDFDHVFDTEILLGYSDGEGLECEGTLDNLLFGNPTLAKIEDFKSHPRPFDPTTFQSKLYPFLVFMNFPKVDEVIFELIFARYANCRRSVTWKREDLPMLRQHVMNARARQQDLYEKHAAGNEDLPAFPGNHCQYCPLLQSPTGCPISEFNPHATVTPEERARFAIWLNQVKHVNDQVLKDVVDASGRPIEVMDGNGRVTQIGFMPTEARQYPLPMVLEALDDWQDASGEDLKPKLFVSSTKLNQYAGAKKRAVLDQYLQDHATLVTKPKFTISAPVDQEERHQRGDEWEGW